MNVRELLARYASGQRNFRGISLVQADLTGANLQGIDLSGAQLCFTVFSHAELDHANLSGANLNGAELLRANLQQTNFSKAQMIGTNLSMAALSHADLSDTTLSWTQFSKANLDHANLSRATLDWTIFVGANLSACKLVQAKITGANLLKANLRGADLRGLDVSVGSRIPIILPNGTRYTPTDPQTALFELECYLGSVDEETYRQNLAKSRETALIKDFLKGQFALLSAYSLQTKETFDAVQLWTRQGELIASLKMEGLIRQAIVKHTSEYWGLIDQLLRDQNFIPIRTSQYEGYIDYEFQEIPSGFQMNFTEARFLWRAWRRQQTQPAAQRKGLFLFHDNQWQLVHTVSLSEGAFFITTDAEEAAILYAGDGAVWLSPITSESRTGEETILQVPV